MCKCGLCKFGSRVKCENVNLGCRHFDEGFDDFDDDNDDDDDDDDDDDGGGGGVDDDVSW